MLSIHQKMSNCEVFIEPTNQPTNKRHPLEINPVANDPTFSNCDGPVVRTSCAQLTNRLLLRSIAQVQAALNQLRTETAHQLDLICDAPAHSIHEAKDSKKQYCPCSSVEAAGNYQNCAPMADTSEGAPCKEKMEGLWHLYNEGAMYGLCQWPPKTNDPTDRDRLGSSPFIYMISTLDRLGPFLSRCMATHLSFQGLTASCSLRFF